MKRMIKRLVLENLLSFRNFELEFGPLNVLIGPNGSGKSNLIEVIGLLQALPRDLSAVFRPGGFREWLWKGPGAVNEEKEARLEVILEIAAPRPDRTWKPFRYVLRMAKAAEAGQVQVTEERLTTVAPLGSSTEPLKFFEVSGGRGSIFVRPQDGRGKKRYLQSHSITPGQSVFRERRDPDQYPEVTHIASQLDRIRLYREWTFGHQAAPRQPQLADEPNLFLEENASNLALVLNRMDRDGSLIEVEHYLQEFAPRFERVSPQIEAGSAQLFLRERGLKGLVPATRLSDGTLRFLALLAITTASANL